MGEALTGLPKVFYEVGRGYQWRVVQFVPMKIVRGDSQGPRENKGVVNATENCKESLCPSV